MFDNGFVNREEIGCQVSNIGVSEQEMVLIKYYSSAYNSEKWLKLVFIC